MMNSTTQNKIIKIQKAALVTLFWLTVWQVLCLILGNNRLLIASPLTVAKRLIELAREEKFWLSIFNSLRRVLTGYLLGAFLGVALGALGSFAGWFHSLLSPILVVIRSAPVTSFVILALVWIKSYNLSVFISFLMVFPIVYSGVREGIGSADKQLLEVAKVYGFSLWKTLRLCYFPALRPFLLASLSTSIGLGWKSGITGEVFALPKNSIGTLLHDAKVYLETADVFCWTAVIILLSLCIEKAVVYLLKKAG